MRDTTTTSRDFEAFAQDNGVTLQLAGVRIHRYRGLEEVVVPLGRVTVLIGPNGAGKSSILEALGYRPTEEGALGRTRDEPASVTWFVRTDTGVGSPIRAALGADRTPELQSAIGSIAKTLVVAQRPDGEERVSLDLFSVLLDAEGPLRASRRNTMLGKLRPAAGTAWVDKAIAVLNAAEDPPPFLDLDVPIDLDLPRPAVVSLIAEANDLSPVLGAHVLAIAEAAFGELRGTRPEIATAIDAISTGYLSPAESTGIVRSVLDELVRRVNAVLPVFVAQHGSVELEVRRGPDSVVGQAMGLVATSLDVVTDAASRQNLSDALALLSSSGETIDLHLEGEVFAPHTRQTFEYSRLGTGIRRWICGAIDEAGRQLADEMRTTPASIAEIVLALEGGSLPDPGVVREGCRIRLVDEPVDGLEPRAHGEVLNWLRAQANRSESLVLATHSASVLGAATNPDDLVVVGVRRTDGRSETTPFGPELLTRFEDQFADLGITREELLFLARGLLLVEGPDDLAIITALYGTELSMRGVMLHALGGSDWRAIITAFEASAYRYLGLPGWALLDGLPDATLPPELRFADPAGETTESHLDRATMRLPDVVLTAVPFEPHDIAAGVALDVYRAVFPKNALPDDRTAMAELTQCRSGGEVKAWFTDKLQMPNASFSAEILQPIARSLRGRRRGMGDASPWLRSSMRQLLAALDDRVTALHSPPPVP